MATRVSISKCKVRGADRWRVRWHKEGKVVRKFFDTRAMAEAHASLTRGEAVGIMRQLASIPFQDQEQLLAIYKECQRSGKPLLGLLSASREAGPETATMKTAIADMDAVKRKAKRDDDYCDSLNQILLMFAAGRESLAVDKITFSDVETFLHTKNIESWSTLRSRLSTFFKFTIRRGWRLDNPCERLEPVRLVKKPPVIFTVEQTETALKWLSSNPRLLAWFVLSTFAGLRPEEAQQTTWSDINFTEGWIRVEAQTTKVRQRRVVYPLPAAMRWLKKAKALKSSLPLGQKPKIKFQKRLREVLKFEEWPKDVTRHTAASYWLAMTGEAAKIATALAHSEATMRRHYMALVTKVEAAKFWNL